MEYIGDLYHKHAEALRRVRSSQRARYRHTTAQLDDVEAEITYLLVRESRPELVVEIGSYHGWSTSWLLHALRDNGYGHLHTYDLVDHATRAIHDERWTFIRGDARETLDPSGAEYVFIDAAHTARFARWYTRELFGALPAGTPVSVHDVFHYSRTLPGHEGRVVMRWLSERGTDHFTASSARAPLAYQWIMEAKRELGLDGPIHGGRHNPMVFFSL